MHCPGRRRRAARGPAPRAAGASTGRRSARSCSYQSVLCDVGLGRDAEGDARGGSRRPGVAGAIAALQRASAATWRRFGLPWIREHHPDWILHTADGAEIHPEEHPGLGAARLRRRRTIRAPGRCASSRASPRRMDGRRRGRRGQRRPTGRERRSTRAPARTIEPDDRATYLAQALSLVHAAMRTQGFFLLAQNGPPEIVEPTQINSADALTAGTGFARLPRRRVGDAAALLPSGAARARRGVRLRGRPRPGREARRLRAGGVPPRRDAAGARTASRQGAAPSRRSTTSTWARPDPDVLAEQVGEAWRRTYPEGAVAVNPSDLPTVLSLGQAGTITLPPGGAAIAVGSRLVTSY